MPVVKEGRLLGVLRRGRFVESKILGRIGYGMHLNSSKKVAELMEQPSLMVEANVPLEEAAQRLQARGTHYLYDDICVLHSGIYVGIVAISDLIEALTERSIVLARGANPLTGLPGNEFIQRGIETRLSQNAHFDVCYIDINLFKPYNDHYGFERGDMVIKSLSAIIGQAIAKTESCDFSFVGHIGGDDFISIMRPQASLRIAETISDAFESMQLEFHGQLDFDRKYYTAQNRRGEEETFSLLSLSIGIVSTEADKIESYAQLASIATEVKKAAKKQSSLSGRSSIIKNRRGEAPRDK
jgi:diguanylate cyclase (GGDEF)-like protein